MKIFEAITWFLRYQFRIATKTLLKPDTFMMGLVLYVIIIMTYNYRITGEFFINLFEWVGMTVLFIVIFIWKLWNKSDWREYWNKNKTKQVWNRIRKTKINQ